MKRFKEKTLDQTNPSYFNLVRERTEKRIVLDCFLQTKGILSNHGPLWSCLDVGCASGYLYFHIKETISEYFGIDVSKKFIQYGKRYFSEMNIRNAQLSWGAFENQSFERKFDVIVCLGLFYVFPNFHHIIDKMLSYGRKLILIRSLFAENSEYRYVPEKAGSPYWTYYNIYGYQEIEEFVHQRHWKASWIDDDYVASLGGHYETAGYPFPFKFLLLTPDE